MRERERGGGGGGVDWEGEIAFLDSKCSDINGLDVALNYIHCLRAFHVSEKKRKPNRQTKIDIKYLYLDRSQRDLMVYTIV